MSINSVSPAEQTVNQAKGELKRDGIKISEITSLIHKLDNTLGVTHPCGQNEKQKRFKKTSKQNTSIKTIPKRQKTRKKMKKRQKTVKRTKNCKNRTENCKKKLEKRSKSFFKKGKKPVNKSPKPQRKTQTPITTWDIFW